MPANLKAITIRTQGLQSCALYAASGSEEELSGSGIGVGAQNVHFEKEGAFTERFL
ncbi:MAG: hypothetical protein ACLTK0_09185 [Anaerovoracaceae bacterium]